MRYLLFVIISSLFLISCEEVVVLDLDSVEPRLVIDGAVERRHSISDENIIEHSVVVTVSLTTDVYDPIPSFVNDAVVSLTNLSNGNVFLLDNVTGNGEYSVWPGGFPEDFPEDAVFEIQNDIEYKLTVMYDDQIYEAIEILNTSVPIDYLVQFEDSNDFKDPEDVAFRIGYVDKPGKGDFYVFKVSDMNFITTEDTFIIDGEFFAFNYFYQDPPEADLTLNLLGSDENTNDYVDGVTELSEGGNGPFSTVPFQLRGNIVNTTNPDNFPFGYFRVNEVYSAKITLIDNLDAPSLTDVEDLINTDREQNAN